MVDDDVETEGIEGDAFVAGTHNRGGSNCKGGHLILAIFSSVCVEMEAIEGLATWALGKLRPLPWHSSIGSISAKTTSSWRASTHHGNQQGKEYAGQLTIVRHGAYLEHTQNSVLQHQGEDPTVKPDTPYLQH
ncbi:hypothetical protein TNCV_887291 [Trichonephila clavipes]|uniref:Uncharacterized protein n=1 Tax=Trichonephila clavipes TaxID=2585209 RepID=A0A8X6URV1_TRICX|nr:hypothetical protein TNCV_887291 [Trichonephila clavipes]